MSAKTPISLCLVWLFGFGEASPKAAVIHYPGTCVFTEVERHFLGTCLEENYVEEFISLRTNAAYLFIF